MATIFFISQLRVSKLACLQPSNNLHELFWGQRSLFVIVNNKASLTSTSQTRGFQPLNDHYEFPAQEQMLTNHGAPHLNVCLEKGGILQIQWTSHCLQAWNEDKQGMDSREAGRWGRNGIN